MKIIIESNVNKYLEQLNKRYQVNRGACDIKPLMDRFSRLNNVQISYDDCEKAIACFCLLIEYGIPLKASSDYLELDFDKTMKLYKQLKTPSVYYAEKFINYLTRNEDVHFKDRFYVFYGAMNQKVTDKFALIIALNIELKLRQGSLLSTLLQETYNYSRPTIRKYRLMITREIENGTN